MPVYVYHCTNCGIQFDKLQSFNDQPLSRCPECGKNSLKKIYQPVGIVFKGSGFYATDNHSPSGQSNQKNENDSTKKSDVKTKDKEKKETQILPKE